MDTMPFAEPLHLSPAPSLRAEILGPAEAAGRRGAWHALERAAVEPNPFCGAAFALAARHLPDHAGTRYAFVWHGERMIAAMPVRPAGRRYLAPLPVLIGGRAYAPLTLPLLDRDDAAAAAAALLGLLAQDGAALLFPSIPLHGPALRLLCAASPRHHVIETTRRAVLDGGMDRARNGWPRLESRRRKELERQRRRLEEELGPLAFALSADAGPLDTFLTLEAMQWKGARGTALGADRALETFIREAAREAEPGAFRIATLTAGGRAVAAGLVLVQGRRGYYFKTAYDPALARFSPGVQLSLDLSAALADMEGIEDVDSLAIENHPMIDRLWPGRMEIASVMVGLRPGAMLALAAGAERLRAWARVKAARLRGR